MAALSAGDSILGMRPASSDGFGGEGGEFSGVMIMIRAGDGREVFEVDVGEISFVGYVVLLYDRR